MENHNPKTGDFLLVDDNKADQSLIMEAFKALGIGNKIVVADNGVEALKYLKSEEQPLLTLCDSNMPEMDGLALCEEISKDKKLKKASIPFVFISSSGSDKDIERAYEYGVQGYFEKAKDFQEAVELLNVIITYWKLCLHPNKEVELIKEA